MQSSIFNFKMEHLCMCSTLTLIKKRLHSISVNIVVPLSTWNCRQSCFCSSSFVEFWSAVMQSRVAYWPGTTNIYQLLNQNWMNYLHLHQLTVMKCEQSCFKFYFIVLVCDFIYLFPTSLHACYFLQLNFMVLRACGQLLHILSAT